MFALMAILLGLWPFTYSGMLWWAAAAIIPIAIHLLSRRRYRETSWAAMQFLMAAVKKHARRLRIEQLILLLLRVFVLILLAIALADPSFYRPAAANRAARGGRTHWVLVIDASYSMDYQMGEQSLFAMAQRAAARLVTDAAEGDGFTLILMGEPPRVLIREPIFDAADVVRQLESLDVRHTGADLTASLREVRQLVDSATRRYPRLSETRVCLFSDLGRSTWEATETEGCRRLVNQLARIARLQVIEFGNSQWQNAAITRLDAASGPAIIDREIQLTAEVRRFSADAPQTGRAEWMVDNQLIREEQMDLTSGVDMLTLAHRFGTPGEHEVQLRLADTDLLDVDNHRWRIVIVRENIRALCIEGSPGAARYVAAALEPRQTEHPLVRWEIVNEGALLERDLADYDCIFLCNVARFTAEQAGALRNYVRGGGGLAVFLGDQVQVPEYNEKLGWGAGDHRILPAFLGELGDFQEPRRFNPLDYKHPIVRPFADHQNAGLLTVPTWRYIRLELPDESAAQIALEFDNGDAALVEERIGRGRVILFASAASASSSATGSQTPWTELAVWPSFLPIVQQMVSLMIENSAAGRHCIAGEPITGTVAQSEADQNVVITTPSGEVERVAVHDSKSSSPMSEWRLMEAPLSGVYRVQHGTADETVRLYAANVDTAESQLDRYDPALLPSQFTVGIEDHTPEATTAAAPYAPASFARWALAALVGMLLLESFLAWHFGTARA